MLHPGTFIEEKLGHASAWARLIAWVRATSMLGIGVTCLILMVGIAMVRLWLTSWVAGSLLTLSIVVGVLAWCVASLVVALRSLDRTELARAVERSHGEPFDRVRAAVHLQETSWHNTDPLQRTFYERIQAQAGAVLRRQPRSRPFSVASAVAWGAAWIVVAVFTMWFFAHYEPFRRLQAAEHASAQPDSPNANSDPGLEIPPEKIVEEAEKPWGEVRISEPGANLRITALDSVAIQIEAAASSPIQSVAWHVAKNGVDAEQTLGPPADPYYAVYREEIDAVARKLEDWDVVSYYAVARTADGKTYESDVYFLEVMPLTHELEELPGGQSGAAYQALNELTRLMDEQEEVVRRAHRQTTAADPQTPELVAERESLAQKENELQRDLRHLEARLEAELEDAVEPQWREPLRQAAESLERTKQALRSSNLNEARDQARTAHANLADARDRLYDATRDAASPDTPRNDKSPLAGTPDKSSDPADRSPPESALDQTLDLSPDSWQDELDKMAAEEKERKSDRDFVSQMAERERNLASRIPPQNPPAAKALLPEQQQIQQAFEQFMQQNSHLSQEVAQEVGQARQSLQDTRQKLEQGTPFANQQAATAAQKLDQLADAMQQANPQQKLNEAYELKKLIEQQSKFLEQVERAPEKFDADKLKNASDAIRESTERLNNLANAPPTRDEFQQPLRDALNDEARQNIAQQCNGMCQNPGSGQAGQSAGQLKQSLNKITNAFEQSLGRSPSPTPDVPSPPTPPQPQPGQPQPGQPQPGQPQPGQPQPGQPQPGQPQPGQPQPGQPQPGQPQPGQPQPGQPQPGQPQPGQPQPGQPQPGQPQPGQPQPGQPQPGQPQPGQPQPGQPQPGQPQPGQPKPGQPQPGQPQPGQPQPGQPQPGQPQPGQPQSGQPQPGQPQSGQQSTGSPRPSGAGWSGTDRLADQAHESLERGIRQVESLARDAERGGTKPMANPSGREGPPDERRESGRLTAEQRRELRAEASRNLSAGIFGTYGHNDRTESVVRGLEDRLADDQQAIDGGLVEEMLRSIQDVRRERVSSNSETIREADVSRGTGGAVPPAYRAPVQRYFQKLSEQR